MNHISWKKYINVRSGASHRPLLEEALNYVHCHRSALDIGAGSMNDSRFLLAQNFKQVTALDSDGTANEYASKIDSQNFNFKHTTFEDFIFEENSYDLINAQYALPFISNDNFVRIFHNIMSSLVKGGVFCGQLFGVHDSSYTKQNTMTFHTRNGIYELLKNLEILKLEEIEKEEPTALGKMRHWHVFHIIVRKIGK